MVYAASGSGYVWMNVFLKYNKNEERYQWDYNLLTNSVVYPAGKKCQGAKEACNVCIETY